MNVPAEATAAGTPVDPRYPVGTFRSPQTQRAEDRAEWIDDIAELPRRIRHAITGLTDAQLDTPYREGGWTVRQVVHHLADSHINSYTRYRLALTEQEPTIRPYEEKEWAELSDARTADPELSLQLLAALHARWVLLLSSLADADWQRTFRHPEHGRIFTLHDITAMYAWHSRHHVAHVLALRDRMGWW